MSNTQMGTRGLSSGDLTRLKRLGGSRDFNANVLQGGNSDIDPTPFAQFGYPPNFHLPKHMGGSKIRRTASAFTDFKAYNHADQVTQFQSAITSPAKTLIATKVCNCTTTNPKKQGLCPSCSYSPVWQH